MTMIDVLGRPDQRELPQGIVRSHSSPLPSRICGRSEPRSGGTSESITGWMATPLVTMCTTVPALTKAKSTASSWSVMQALSPGVG